MKRSLKENSKGIGKRSPIGAQKRMAPSNGKPRCKGCGFRIRGEVYNHENGKHHTGIRRGK